MVNFAELKAKAEKAKDASVGAVTNTRDRFSSTPSSKVQWDPNWKRAPPAPATSSSSPRASTSGPPPPPMRSRPDVIASGAPPALPRASRPTDVDGSPAPPPYIPLPPPTRAASAYPPSHDAVTKIDWAHLSAEDKEAFFEWLDEFFSRYLGVALGPREKRPAASTGSAGTTPAVRRMQAARPPPTVNMATRPPA